VEKGEGSVVDDSILAERGAAAIKERLGVTASIELLERGCLPRSGYKVNRVVDS
jgi:phenylacetate-coenzyme A ligase PaaK-like adenylate-forming protein